MIKGNDLSGSTSYGLNNLTTNAIDARYNYWGLVETTTLKRVAIRNIVVIYDGRDDSVLHRQLCRVVVGIFI